MRILFILPSLSKQGPVVVAYELVTKLVEHGHDCTVDYFDTKENNVLSFPCRTKRICLYYKMNFDDYDVVHTHGLRPDLFLFMHKPILRKTNTRFISTVHNFVLKDFSTQYNKLTAIIFGNLWMFLLKRHDLIVVLSNVARNYYRRWFQDEKMRVIYNTRIVSHELAVLTDVEQKEIDFFKNGDYLLGVNAMLTPIKGIDLILKSMPFIKDVKLFIVGDGKSRNELEAMSNNLGIADRVYFAGYKQDAYRYIPSYDLYLIPSRSEGFPLAMLEAVVLRKNIVCSDISVFKEIFSNDEVTFFELENVTSLVNAIKYALANDKSDIAYAHYLKSYSPDSFVEAYLSVYSEKR